MTNKLRAQIAVYIANEGLKGNHVWKKDIYAELARLCSVKPDAIKMWTRLTNPNLPTLRDALIVARYLGVFVEEIFVLEEEETK